MEFVPGNLKQWVPLTLDQIETAMTIMQLSMISRKFTDIAEYDR
jgi:hypothetical protein